MIAWEVAADIGSRLRELREMLDWTQEDLGKELGRSRQSVLHWEAGRVRPPRRPLEDFCRRHHLPLDIFTEGGARPRELLLAESRGAVMAHSPRALQGSSPGRAAASEPDQELEGAIGPIGGPATWDEEQLLLVLDRLGEIMEARQSGLDPPGIRQLKIVALKGMIRAARDQRRLLPDSFYRVLHDLEAS